jgi:hypothetical protein
MTSSSQATTASAGESDDDNNATPRQAAEAQHEYQYDQTKKTTQHDKHTKLKAIARWIDDGQQREQAGLMFDLQYHALYNTAFFKLRASVVVKGGLIPEQVSLFMFLAPESIRTLSLSRDHAQELGPDTVCLRFNLGSSETATPAVVVPKAMDLSHVTWKNKMSADVWTSLQSLVRAMEFNVLCCLPRRVMSEARLQSLCEALSNRQVTSTPGYPGLGGLYGGKGGKMVPAEVMIDHRPSNETLPAYEDIEPGPPLPPMLPEKMSNKRRRGSSDTGSQRILEKSRDDLEATVAWLVTELKEYKAREALLLSELREVHAKVSMLVSQQEQHRAKCAMLENDLHNRIGEVEAKLDELDEDLEARLDCKIDETLDQKSDNIKEELVEHIDEILPNRIQGALEEVTFSARF